MLWLWRFNGIVRNPKGWALSWQKIPGGFAQAFSGLIKNFCFVVFPLQLASFSNSADHLPTKRLKGTWHSDLVNVFCWWIASSMLFQGNYLVIPWSTKGTSLLGHVGRKSVKISVAWLACSLLQCDPIGAKKGESETSIWAFSPRIGLLRQIVIDAFCVLGSGLWKTLSLTSQKGVRLGFWAAQGKGYVDYVSTLFVLGSFCKAKLPNQSLRTATASANHRIQCSNPPQA